MGKEKKDAYINAFKAPSRVKDIIQEIADINNRNLTEYICIVLTDLANAYEQEKLSPSKDQQQNYN